MLNEIKTLAINLFQWIYSKFMFYLPNFLISFLILISGYLIGRVVAALIEILLGKVLNVDRWLEMKGIKKFLNIGFSKFFANLGKWYVYLSFISYALFYSQLSFLVETSNLLNQMIPKIFAALLILFIGIFIAEIFRGSLKRMKLPYSKQISNFLRFLIIYIAGVIALDYIGINVEILIEFFRIGILGLTLAFSIALGIAFGFAIRKDVEKFWKEMKKGKKK